MDPIDDAVVRAERLLEAGDPIGAARCIEQFESARPDHLRLALVWARLLPAVGNPRVLERQMRALSAEWPRHPIVALTTAEAGTRWTDPWPTAQGTDRLAALAVDVIERCLSGERVPARWLAPLHLARGRALARMSPSAEDEALAAFETALGADGDLASGWADLARLHQVRTRWQKGLAAAEHALGLDDSRQARWTAAVCATALADPSAAAHWARLDHGPARTDDDGRPRIADLPPVEAYLSPSLLGAAPSEGPVEAEVVWVRPMSPAHGRIASPTVLDLPVNLDDVVVWDPVPRGFRAVGEQEVPCFTVLARLAPGRKAVWRVVGRPDREDCWPDGWSYYDLGARVGDPALAGCGRLITPRTVSRSAVRAALTARGSSLEEPGG